MVDKTANVEGQMSAPETPLRSTSFGRKGSMCEVTEPLLSVKGLSISFLRYTKGFRRHVLSPVSDLYLDVFPGEIVAVIGSSGSGKSLLAHAILGILPSNAFVSGEITFRGKKLTEEALTRLRGKYIGLIPQSVNFLDPLMKVRGQLRSVQGKRGRGFEYFWRLGLDQKILNLYPFQLSGGMARRVLFASALSEDPELVIADEPTPGLHPELAFEIMSILRELADEGKAVLLISHDITLSISVADRVAVFYAGTTLELAPASDFRGEGKLLRHPYTRDLWLALPSNQFRPVGGRQPSMSEKGKGCPYEPRCNLADRQCSESMPSFRDLRKGKVRCFHAT